jgi:hypothetical protein
MEIAGVPGTDPWCGDRTDASLGPRMPSARTSVPPTADNASLITGKTDSAFSFLTSSDALQHPQYFLEHLAHREI